MIDCWYYSKPILDGQDLWNTGQHLVCMEENRRRDNAVECVYCGKDKKNKSSEACLDCISTNNGQFS